MKDFIRAHPYLLPWTGLLGLLLAVGVVGAVQVWGQGLIVTGLHDLVPWGLWITLDLSAIGLGAGAFLLSAAIYLLRLEEFKPLARIAVLVGLLGYTSASLALLLDLGRPERFWHPLAFPNVHSVLWEITMCVILYTGVLFVEFVPVVGHSAWLEQRLPGLARLMQKVHGLAPVMAVAGLLLSLLHQSSLGATYGVLPFRPLWGKPSTAVLFLGNAVAAGPALTIVATLVAQRVLRRELVPRKTLLKLGRFVGIAMAVYLYVRLWDTLAMSYTHLPGRMEGLDLLTRGPLWASFWIGELLLGAAVPALLLLIPRLRKHPASLWVAGILAAQGLVWMRWDVNLSAQLVQIGHAMGEPSGPLTSYRPTWVEWATSAGIVAYALLGFSWALHLFPVFASDQAKQPAKEPASKQTPAPVKVGSSK
jgi:molybdopterin-containing oxidoreductase family membrane subunit